jgi:hypothetical protein
MSAVQGVRQTIKRARWGVVGLVCAALAVTGCAPAGVLGPLSDEGQAIMIVIARQPVYTQPTCSGDTAATLLAGNNVVDLETAGTNCEQVVYMQNGSYSAIGYLPVYGMRRAAGGVRCRAEPLCHLRSGPGTTYGVIGEVAHRAAARGYGTANTGAIITDGDNFDWWEVVAPSGGQRADIFGPNCQAF